MGRTRLEYKDGKLLVCGVALLLVLYHLSVSRVLSQIGTRLTADLADDDERGPDFRRLEALKASIMLGRLLAMVSAGFAASGLVGVLRDRLAPIKAFTLSAFISLGAECVCLILICSLAFSAASSTSFCEALTSNSDWSSGFDLGWSVESCEERWQGLATALLSLIGFIAVLRAFAAFQVLSYYTSLSKRSRRQPLSINTQYSDTPSGGARDSPLSAGGTSSSGNKRGQRIFLLPSPLNGSGIGMVGDVEGAMMPLVEVTPSSPLASFPPPPATSTSSSSSSSATVTSTPHYVVYAPVIMTPDQARAVGAQEVFASRPRSRSHTSSPPTATPANASGGVLPFQMEDTAATSGKGKLA
ncbi:hypothetical protein T439DRAFT_328143 [Meredithblackwellia eburnea MCA 4105]